MLEGDVIHSLEEFGQFPWERFSTDQLQRDWTIARGGYGLPNHLWHIDHIDRRGNVEIWNIPSSLSNLFDWWTECGREEVRAELRKVIGMQ